MGLNNAFVKEHMDALFGADRAETLREEMEALEPMKRELLIVERISEALQEMSGTYVLPFCFKNESGTRTSHYLIFVSKHILGYNIMRLLSGFGVVRLGPGRGAKEAWCAGASGDN